MGTTRTTENRTDDEKTVPAQGAKETAAIPETTEAEAAGKAAAKADEQADDNAALAAQDEAGDLEADDALDAPDSDPHTAGSTTGIAAGAGAVVAAGLGLASVTGTWLGTTLAERANLVGQIKVQSGKAQAADQISAVYGASWHTNALVNGFFALLAVIVATVVATTTRNRPTWVRAVAWGGLVLGVLGILISAGMYLDLFGNMPTVPKAPAGGGAGPAAP
ncbi:hypothetical protein RM550_06855 [Streptomyces sp. DSM 41527]|uniref:Integral membrane protein n=1 Tax=Streptomyces mooreae TaxID=3075523 RepID=A0ABU2T2J5_9ACTN|nr:hypothetical protein [Streptomyces sp. DSM 41527]MDT0455457.1 hypothetical protein [Streptomyces sp. DSM 41527]